MNVNKFFRTRIMLIFILASVQLAAQDTITLTWRAEGISTKLSLDIQATYGKAFTVNWGDGTIETKTGIEKDLEGQSNYLSLIHTYTETDEVYTIVIAASDDDCRFSFFNCASYWSVDWVWVNNHQVLTLYLTDCSALEKLLCYGNKLSSLNLKNCSALRSLSCYNNQLSVLDLTGCSVLWYLGCWGNQLSTLNLSDCPILYTIETEQNKLTELNLNCSLALESLNCTENQLTDLDLTGYSSLKYLGCSNNQLTSLNITNCTSLINFYCNDNQLTELYFVNCPLLKELQCYNNKLQLSDLYAAHLLIEKKWEKHLGTQNLPSQTVLQGGIVDFSAQRIFGGISTYFTIEKNGVPATPTDYSIDNGKITFNRLGIYTVTMTNDVIVSDTEHPAVVIAEINAGNVAISENILSNIKVYPIPTNDILIIECENINTIKLYDMLGKEVFNQTANGKTEINIGHLLKGIYVIQITSDGNIIGNRKIVKK